MLKLKSSNHSRVSKILEMPFGCSICKKSFAKAASLSKHVEQYHSRKEPKTTANTETMQEQIQTNEIKEFDKIQKVHEAEKHNLSLNNSKECYNENYCNPKNSNQRIIKDMNEKENHINLE